jgi:hypothetical protein
MGPRLIALAAMIALLSSAPALGQKATEQFIPIGQSPGLSGQYTSVGTIEAADATGRTISVGGRSVQVTERTRIWLDFAAGGFDDLQPGRRAEVMYEDDARKEFAAWIKVVTHGQ